MLWFFSFTALGISIFAFFLALNELCKFSLGNILGGTILLGLLGWVSAKFA